MAMIEAITISTSQSSRVMEVISNGSNENIKGIYIVYFIGTLIYISKL